MVQYRDLNAPPARTLAQIVADMRASERQSKTGDAGVKDLGEEGDVLWETPSGPTSVRVESENMRQLGIDLGELNEVILPELADDLDAAKADLQAKLDAANARIDDLIVDGGGAGNFTTYSINEPSGTGTGEGDQWFRVVNGEVLGQWRWDGAAWVPVTLTDAVIAGIDLSKLVSNGNLSEVVANKIWADLFAANKITAQEIESGSITSQHIASEGIIADVIQGGHFTGETFEGGTFIGGEIRTSDELPGQVSLRDDGYVDGDGVPRPGIRINPTSTYNPSFPPGIGSNANGLIITGGTSAGGDRAFAAVQPDAVALTSRNTGVGRTSELYANTTEAVMYSRSATGARGSIRAKSDFVDVIMFDSAGKEISSVHATPSRAGIAFGQGLERRVLNVDAYGVWVETNKSGSRVRYNLEETAKDTGWVDLPYSTGFMPGGGAPLAYRLSGNLVHLRGRVAKSDGKMVTRTSYPFLTLPASIRPAYDLRTVIAGGSDSQWGRLNVAPSGATTVAMISGDVDWFDLAGTVWTVD